MAILLYTMNFQQHGQQTFEFDGGIKENVHFVSAAVVILHGALLSRVTVGNIICCHS
jgi:hypothetical protein